jgi:hypothetical protein
MPPPRPLAAQHHGAAGCRQGLLQRQRSSSAGSTSLRLCQRQWASSSSTTAPTISDSSSLRLRRSVSPSRAASAAASRGSWGAGAAAAGAAPAASKAPAPCRTSCMGSLTPAGGARAKAGRAGAWVGSGWGSGSREWRVWGQGPRLCAPGASGGGAPQPAHLAQTRGCWRWRCGWRCCCWRRPRRRSPCGTAWLRRRPWGRPCRPPQRALLRAWLPPPLLLLLPRAAGPPGGRRPASCAANPAAGRFPAAAATRVLGARSLAWRTTRHGRCMRSRQSMQQRQQRLRPGRETMRRRLPWVGWRRPLLTCLTCLRMWERCSSSCISSSKATYTCTCSWGMFSCSQLSQW